MAEDFNKDTSNADVYHQFDQESIEHDVDGTGVTVIGEQLGTALRDIERFVEEAVLTEGPAFTTDLRGRLVECPLARHRGLMNSYFRLYSPLNGYSPYVDLFFATALDFPDFQEPWQFNGFVEELRGRYRSEEFQRVLQTQSIDEKKLSKSLTQYVDALFARHARLLLVRIDLLYRHGGEPVTLERALADFDRFMANSRHNKIFKGKVGFIRRLEFGDLRGHYHFHLLYFFHGSNRHRGYHACELLGEYWKKITNGLGHFENCNKNESAYKAKGILAIGMVNHHEFAKRDNLRRVINYFVKRHQLLRRKAVGVTKAITRGEMPAPKANNVGRPRGSSGAVGPRNPYDALLG
jgi:hypothetical protein